MYNVEYTKKAEKGLKQLRKSEPDAFKKAMGLLLELMEPVQPIFSSAGMRLKRGL